jgi:hypothetical protein
MKTKCLKQWYASKTEGCNVFERELAHGGEKHLSYAIQKKDFREITRLLFNLFSTEIGEFVSCP